MMKKLLNPIFAKILFAVAVGYFSPTSAIASGGFTTGPAPEPPPPGYCEVTACEGLRRWTLSPSKVFSKAMTSTCPSGMLPKEDAVQGTRVTSQTRWYPGSFRPPKIRNPYYLDEVKSCTPKK